jgi:hypothetical protein
MFMLNTTEAVWETAIVLPASPKLETLGYPEAILVVPINPVFGLNGPFWAAHPAIKTRPAPRRPTVKIALLKHLMFISRSSL